MKKAILFACLSVLAISAAFGQQSRGSYEPDRQDFGITRATRLIPGTFNDFRKVYMEKIQPAAIADSLVRDVYAMVSEDENEVLILMLNAPKYGDDLFLAPLVVEQTKRFMAGTYIDYYRVMAAFNEGYYPEPGDKAVVITRHIKEGMFEEAKAYLESQMLKSLAVDKYRRYYIVLEQKATNTLVAYSLLRGEIVSDPKVVEVRESGFNRFMAKPFEMKVYTFFAIDEE